MKSTLSSHWARATAAILAAAGLCFTGCATRPGADYVIGPSYKPANVCWQDAAGLRALRRVALLPLATRSGQPDLASGQATLEPVLHRELTKTGRFEVVPIAPEDLLAWTGRSTWLTAEPLPERLLAQLRETYNCDGVLFPQLTQFRAYPPLVVGWNLKLADTQSGRILWAADEVFDAGQPAVAAGARRYQGQHSLVRSDLADSRLVLISPTAFGDYSAATLLAMIEPPRD